MSPVRTGLAFVSLLASLLIGIALFSPAGSILAQGAEATATEIPYDNLPWCDLTTPNALTPTAIPNPLDTSNITCRLPTVTFTDVGQAIEEGKDPNTLGVGGDPLNGGIGGEAATPTPEATSLSPASVDSPHQLDKLYLPMMQTNASSPSNVANSDKAASDSDEPYPGYIPYDQLP